MRYLPRTLLFAVLLSVHVAAVGLPVTSIPLTPNGKRANMTVAYLRYTPTDDRVWFTVDPTPGESNPDKGKVYYNRRYFTGTTWVWQYATSVEVMNLGNASAAIGEVLFDAYAPFRDPDTGVYYKYIATLVSQPSACDGVVAGFFYLAFSNTGTSWVGPRKASYTGMPYFPCAGTTAIPVENVGAVYDYSSGMLWYVGVEGNIAELGDATQMDDTLTTLGWVSSTSPTSVNIVGMVSNSGLFQPIMAGAGSNTDYKAYAYFINLGFTYYNGYVYLGRAYPYPFTRLAGSELTPCGDPNDSCLEAPYTLPNRLQLYRMYVGSMANIGNITTGTWSLRFDAGHGNGLWNSLDGSCDPTPLVSGQENWSTDYGYFSFYKNPDGTWYKASGTGYILSGDTFADERSQSTSCSISNPGQNLITTSQ
jgi:hypothetical protein